MYWPDGHQTKGIEKHIEDLKGMFVYAPDMRIKGHPVKIASGEWTSVIGVMEGTFMLTLSLVFLGYTGFGISVWPNVRR